MLTTVPVALDDNEATRAVPVTVSEMGAVTELVGMAAADSTAEDDGGSVDSPDIDERCDVACSADGPDDTEAPSDVRALLDARPDVVAARDRIADPEEASEAV